MPLHTTVPLIHFLFVFFLILFLMHTRILLLIRLTVHVSFISHSRMQACLLYLESPPPPPLQLPSTPVHTHQPPDSQQTAAGAALLSESKACALLNVTVSRGRFSFAKELILEWKWRALTKLSLDGQRKEGKV